MPPFEVLHFQSPHSGWSATLLGTASQSVEPAARFELRRDGSAWISPPHVLPSPSPDRPAPEALARAYRLRHPGAPSAAAVVEGAVDDGARTRRLIGRPRQPGRARRRRGAGGACAPTPPEPPGSAPPGTRRTAPWQPSAARSESKPCPGGVQGGAWTDESARALAPAADPRSPCKCGQISPPRSQCYRVLGLWHVPGEGTLLGSL
mmetsp:Transcript_22663/g.43314  ORF Transcript_22663/g.43314 Transcript_22663/m.43314 type:complete len:206 (-) Transcript_22663:327-944(-)